MFVKATAANKLAFPSSSFDVPVAFACMEFSTNCPITKVKPNLLFLIYELWIRLGNLLGWINSRLVLGIVFIFVLLPISFFMRILGYDPLRLKRRGKKTYREIRKNNRIRSLH